MKRILRNFEKVLDKADRFGYNRQAAQNAAGSSQEAEKKFFLRNFKKVLDKVEGFGYNRKAAVDAAGEP